MASRRITCPDCAATYDVPEAQARIGRAVRCAGCGTQWLAFDEPADAGMPESEVPVPQVDDEATATNDADALTGSRSIAASLRQHSVPAQGEAVEGSEAAAPEDDADWADAELPDFTAAQHEIAQAPTAAPKTAELPATGQWRAAWAASVLLLMAIGFGGVHWRGPIMLGWPPSTRLYAAFGTPHMPRAATAERVAPAAARAISSSPSTIRPPGVSE